MKIPVRRATPEDGAALAAVEVRSWRAAYRGLMPDAFLDGISEAEKTGGKDRRHVHTSTNTMSQMLFLEKPIALA